MGWREDEVEGGAEREGAAEGYVPVRLGCSMKLSGMTIVLTLYSALSLHGSMSRLATISLVVMSVSVVVVLVPPDGGLVAMSSHRTEAQSTRRKLATP